MRVNAGTAAPARSDVGRGDIRDLMPKVAELSFTGERYLASLDSPEIAYEHWHRYLFASQLVTGLDVLDVASGEGYGSALLARSARQVVGVDLSPDAVEFAASRYPRANLRFLRGSAGAIPLEGQGHFDAVVSFETIEHLDAVVQQAFLAEVRRLLRPNGLLVVSTPNRAVYSDQPGYRNDFHLKEFYPDEFRAFLRGAFRNVEFLAQRVFSTSYLWTMDAPREVATEFRLERGPGGFGPSSRPKPDKYLVAVCSDAALPALNGSLLVDLDDRLQREGWERAGLAERKAQAAELRARQLAADLAEARARLVVQPAAPASRPPVQEAAQLERGQPAPCAAVPAVRLGLLIATQDDISHTYWKPLGLGYLKSYAQERLPQLQIEIHDSLAALLASKPDVAGVSTSTENFAIALAHIERIRSELGIPVLLGGIHVTLMPQTTPPGVIGVVGEAETTVVELMAHFLCARRFEPEVMTAIPGLVFHGEDGQLVRTAARPLIEPLDQIPYPDRAALGIQPGRESWLYMFTSRGCPYACKFCVSRKHWSRYREFSADYVLGEIAHLIRDFQVRHIHFFDDLFVVNRKRLRAIAAAFTERKLSIETSCAVRANLVDDELCQLLKQLNVSEVMFGAESFSEPVLKVLKASSVTVADNLRAMEILKRHGIKLNVTVIFNAPEERREDLLASWKALFAAIREGKINKMAWGLLRPYPGSDYWDAACARGIVGDEMDWNVFKNWHDKRFHMNDHMSFEEVQDLCDEWQTKCYVANLGCLDGTPLYPNKTALFEARRERLEAICKRVEKDDSDLFVEREYRQYLAQQATRPRLALGEGWEGPCGGTRWARREATFELTGVIPDEADLLNVNFYVPDLRYYSEGRLTVTAELGPARSTVTVARSGLQTVSVQLDRARGAPLAGRLVCSDDFRPSRVSNSSDSRPLSMVVASVELARAQPRRVVSRIDIGA
jgi:radical SAM superfamily enzyme YgiQ (UPF0313 family)/SAM-dependent methyltransferase